MKKKLTAWALAAAVLLSQLPPVDIMHDMAYTASAEGGASVEAQASGTGAVGLKPGDKVYVDVSISQMYSCSYALNAVWDRDSFELTNAVPAAFGSSSIVTYVPFIKNGSTAEAEQSLKDYQNKKTDDVCIFAFSSGFDYSCAGTVVTLEFTVTNEAENGWSDIEVYFDGEDGPKYFGSDNSGVSITVTQSAEEEHDGKVPTEVTGGKFIDPGIRAITFGESEGTLEPEFSQEITEYTYTIPADENGIPEVETVLIRGATAQITQATDLENNNTAVIMVQDKKGTIFKVHFVKEVSNKAAAPVIIPERDSITFTSELISILSGNEGSTIYYTTDGTDPTTESKVYTNYFTVDSLDLPLGTTELTVKAMAVEEDRDPSKIVTRTYTLPDPGALLTGITVNGKEISGFHHDLIDYVYTMSYEEWKAADGKVTVSGTSFRPDSSTVTPAELTFGCTDGKGETQTGVVTVRSANGDSREYSVHVTVDNCPHTRSVKSGEGGTCGQLNEVTTSCAVCGKVFGTELEIVEHSAGAPVTEVADCGHDGYTVMNCEVCGEELYRSIIEASGEHQWTESTSGDTTTYTCSVCGAVKKTVNTSEDGHIHDFSGAVTVTKAASCTEYGIQQRACSVSGCTAYQEELIDRTEHSYEEHIQDATCTEKGVYEYVCSVCGAVESSSLIEPYGHSFDFGNTAPSCKEDIVVEAECENGCGTKQTMVIPRSTRHSFDYNEMKSDEVSHWYECTVCGAKEDHAAHVKDDQWVQTAEDPNTWINVCAECEYVMATETIVPPEPYVPEEVPVHQHTFGDTWSTDGTAHWHECACGEKADSAEHTSDGSWKTNSSKHWKVCDVCGTEIETGFHRENEGVAADGIITYSCIDCGYVIRVEDEVPPHVHSYSKSDRILCDSTGHWYNCSCGEKMDFEAHTEDAGRVVQDATIRSKGEKVYSCVVCGYELRTEVIPVAENPLENAAAFETAEGEEVSFTYTDENTGAQVEIPAGQAEKVEIVADIASIGMATEESFKEENDVDVAAIYDISMYMGDHEVQPTGTVVVSIAAPENEDISTLSVYHQVFDNGKMKFVNMNAMPDGNGNLVFETDHFSIYIIAKEPQQYGILDIGNEIINGTETDEFNVTVTLSNDGYYVTEDEEEITVKNGTPTTFTLKNGEPFYIHVPAGTKYTVTMAEKENYEIISENASGTVKAGLDSEADFFCVYTKDTGSLTIKNTVTGKNDEFTFDITLGVNAVIEINGEKSIIRGLKTVKLKNGETVNILYIPDGTEYSITPGGDSTAENASGVISSDSENVTVSFNSRSEETPKPPAEEEGGNTPDGPNTPGQQTPSTPTRPSTPAKPSTPTATTSTADGGKDSGDNYEAEDVSSQAGIYGDETETENGFFYVGILALMTAAGIFVCRRRNRQK